MDLTPRLLLDEELLNQNLDRMRQKISGAGVSFRPHHKTAKSIDVANRVREYFGDTGVAVSTLKEAERFFESGVDDILYAVGVTPCKFEQIGRLCEAGANLKIILETVETAAAVSDFNANADRPVGALIEIDSDGHRAGIAPDAPELLEIAGALNARRPLLAGVMTHAGGSYNCIGERAITQHAEKERSAVVLASTRLREAGFECPIVSVGSTPTIMFAESFEGVTEVRAGVFMFQDLVMAGVGVCSTADIAISVLCSVIGYHRASGGVIVDAGWMAMSRDRGTASQPIDYGLGLACNAEGTPLDDVFMAAANQEHGILRSRSGVPLNYDRFPIGLKLRILPNHACATAAQHDAYHLVDRRGEPTGEIWPRFSGW